MPGKTSQIRFDVSLDDNLVPERIEWEADDQAGRNAAKSALISLWDEREKSSLRIDLWTKEMTTDEMKAFFHQNLLTLADTFERATGEKEMAGHMRAFGRYFGERMCGIDPQG
jgi:gliding motility-associated protein GldC